MFSIFPYHTTVLPPFVLAFLSDEKESVCVHTPDAAAVLYLLPNPLHAKRSANHLIKDNLNGIADISKQLVCQALLRTSSISNSPVLWCIFAMSAPTLAL